MSKLERVGNPSVALTGDPATDFARIIDGLKQRVPPYNPNLTMEQNAQGFIDAMNALSGGTDKKVDANELAAYLGIKPEEAQKFIDKYNSPGDGDKALDVKELANALQAQAEDPGGGQQPGGAQKGEGGGGGEPTGQPAGGQPPNSLSSFIDFLKQLMDEDQDGEVSEKERASFMEKFDKSPKDGQLSPDELAEALKAAAQKDGKTLSDADIESMLAPLQDGMKTANTDGKEGWSDLELAAILTTSPEAQADT